MTAAVNGAPAVLALTADPRLEADLSRLAAAAGAGLEVMADPGEARSAWSRASVVLVGPDALSALAVTSPPRRERVHVVARDPIPDALFRAALSVGAESVLELPAAESWLVETLTDTADGTTGGGGVVCVVGGSGGAGATTFAAALAAVAASDLPGASDLRPVTLVDADPLGPGIEHVAGVEDLAGTRWGPLLESAGRLGSRSLLASLPQSEGLAVLGWGSGARLPLTREVVREVLSAAQRGSELVVVDLPRYSAPVTQEVLHRCDHLVLVTTLTLPAVASAAQVVSQVVPHVSRCHLVARGPVSALDPDHVSAALGMPLVAEMADQRRLAEAIEMGLGPVRERRGPLARAARATLGALG